MVGLYISFGDWANALECWRSPSLRLVIPGIAVSPGVTHSDSRIVFVTGTVVKPQQPTNQRLCERERPSLLDLLSEFGLISDGWLGSISPLGDWANALECWRSPSLRLVIPGIAVPPGVTHSDSHHLWYEHCRKTSTTTTTPVGNWLFVQKTLAVCTNRRMYGWKGTDRQTSDILCNAYLVRVCNNRNFYTNGRWKNQVFATFIQSESTANHMETKIVINSD